MALDVKIEGLAELKSQLAKLGANVSKELADAGEKGMLVLEADIKRRAPVDVGELRDSYNTEVSKIGGDVVVTTGTDKKYAVWQEYGTGIHAEAGNGRKTPWVYENRKGEKVFTHGNKPRPHVRPAIDATQNDVVAVVENELRKAIGRST